MSGPEFSTLGGTMQSLFTQEESLSRDKGVIHDEQVIMVERERRERGVVPALSKLFALLLLLLTAAAVLVSLAPLSPTVQQIVLGDIGFTQAVILLRTGALILGGLFLFIVLWSFSQLYARVRELESNTRRVVELFERKYN
jgi:hypothetical protein